MLITNHASRSATGPRSSGSGTSSGAGRIVVLTRSLLPRDQPVGFPDTMMPDAGIAPSCRFQCFRDRKSTRLNSSHSSISYAVFCLKKKKNKSFYYYSCKKKKNQKK